MSDTQKSTPKRTDKVKDSTREERLAEALRANLKKRRVQTHARKDAKDAKPKG